MLALAPAIAACIRRLDAGFAPSADDLVQIERALAGDLDEGELIALARLLDRNGPTAPGLDELDERLHRALEGRPTVRRRCEQELAVPALLSAPQRARRDPSLIGIYTWTEHAGETSFALTHTTFLALHADGSFERGLGSPIAPGKHRESGAADRDRGVWSGERSRLLLAADVRRYESYAYQRGARSLSLVDDEGVRHLLSPLASGG